MTMQSAKNFLLKSFSVNNADTSLAIMACISFCMEATLARGWMQIMSELLHKIGMVWNPGPLHLETHSLPPTALASMLNTRPWPVRHKSIVTSWTVSHITQQLIDRKCQDCVYHMTKYSRRWLFTCTLTPMAVLLNYVVTLSHGWVITSSRKQNI